MSRTSLRTRVTTFYVGMLAIALLVFSGAVYFGVQTFLTRSLERSLNLSAHNIATDYLMLLDSKGNSWFLREMSESHPQGVGDSFVRVSNGNQILYQTGDMKDPFVSTSTLPLPSGPERFHLVRRERVRSGQQMILCSVPYRSPSGDLFLVEVGSTTEPIQYILRSLFLVLLITTPLILTIAALGGYVLMSRPLQPVVTLTEQAERVGRIDLGERLPIIATGDELERLSLALNRMIERLEETVAHNRRFSADASHELRTPLAIIRGELEVLLQTPDLQPAVTEGACSALEECNRMSWIVESLMTISRLDGGGERMEMAPVDLVSITRITLDHLMLLAEEKQISLRFGGQGAILVTGNTMRLKQVIVNLVDNAIKYTQVGGSVEVAVSASGGSAALNVSDTGIGIPANALPFIFERFYRADEVRSRASGGMGLGLAIVKSICTAHGGTITATSVNGQGSVLRVELPLLDVSTVAVSNPVDAAPLVRRGCLSPPGSDGGSESRAAYDDRFLAVEGLKSQLTEHGRA
jgi:signal transduction histidine kinase